MRKGQIIVFFLVFSLAFCSCSPRVIKEIVTETKIEYRDSVAWRDSIIRVPIPLGKDQTIVEVGDTSTLETTVARSVAYIGEDGKMHHSLENKKGTIDAVVKIPSHFIWTNVTNTSRETLTKEVKVEKEFTWWQKFRIGAFWWLLGGLVLALIWIFRKLIIKL